jgi:signal transduction histidine kinase
MRQNVPLAAPELTPVQNPDQERVVVPGAAGMTLGEPAWEAFYALVFIASAILVESAALSTSARVLASLALTAMVPWYLCFGRRVIRLDMEAWERTALTWRGPAYLTGLTVFFAIAVHANPSAWFLAFAYSPQCFQVTTPRRAMGFVVVLNGVAALVSALAHLAPQSALAQTATALFAIGFSWVFNRWAVRVVEQSHERAALLAQLEAAQAELAAANHEAGVLAERQRLSAEIHDTLAQGFLSIVTLIQAAQASRGGTPARVHLDLALATARENLAEARTLVADLAPASLDDGGLSGAVARAADATAWATGIEASCATEGAVRPLPTAAEVVLLRVGQEALANVRRHAAATCVDVRLCYTSATVWLSVTDNGCGFADAGAASPGPASQNRPADPAAVSRPGGGFGLRGLRERLRQVGGTLIVTSAPGAGTVVRAEIPV